ncbi:hypothetical protein BC828DRAFT_382351 [Blastocladiella britannica]|nr:hypothetical protein BC828DRAFT_382351 [Blastocladiella britannica]
MSVLAPPRRSTVVPGSAGPAAQHQPPPTPQELRSHLIFWVTLVVLGAGERVGDRLLRLMPFYGSAKWLVLTMLMVTKHMGTYVLFTNRLRPWFRKYQKVIELWITIYPQRALAQAVALLTTAYAQYRALSTIPAGAIVAGDESEDQFLMDESSSGATSPTQTLRRPTSGHGSTWMAAAAATLPAGAALRQPPQQAQSQEQPSWGSSSAAAAAAARAMMAAAVDVDRRRGARRPESAELD